MRIVKASVQNFGSYKSLDFDFDDQGLCLIQGATGSGKSTLCDIIPWVLFGVTAKDGTADEVRAWSSEKDTVVDITLEVNTNQVYITRVRGRNDLYYSVDASPEIRGKDLKDTQKQINELLGMTSETYLAGAYFHEFSKTASFFITTAKNRRSICEQIVDLSVPLKLQERILAEKKLTKDKHAKDLRNLQDAENKLQSSTDTIVYLAGKQKTFEQDKEAEVNKYVILAEKHELALEQKKHELDNCKKQLFTLENSIEQAGKCKHCGAENQSLLRQYNTLKTRIATLKTSIKEDNPYLNMVLAVSEKENTYNKDIEKYEKAYASYLLDVEKYTAIVAANTQEALDLELLAEVNENYRSGLISSTIGFIQDKTNEYLSNYFDAEIKVTFDVSAADKIDVEIYKDANLCSYTQLSKGQRQLLKLCFGIAVMQAVTNKSGVQFNSIFFDEALDGLSDDLKLKAYRLFQNLALTYSSVFLVDHSSELKAICEKQYIVTLENGNSTINEES